MTLKRLLAAAPLLAAAACVSVPPQPIDPAASAQKLAARKLDDPGAAGWSLDALTLAAWRLRPDVVAAAADVSAGNAAERVAGELPNPTLTLDPGYLYDNANHNVSPWTIVSALNFTIETANKREIRTAQAHAEAEVRRWQLAETLWHVRQDVRKALLAYELARTSVALAEDELTLRNTYADWVETQIRFGAASFTDRLTAQGAQAQARAAARMAHGEIAVAETALAAAIGVAHVPADRIAPVALAKLPAPDETDPTTLRDWGVVNRLSVRHALADYMVSEQALRLAVAKQYPDVALGPGHTYDKGDRGLTLNIGFTLPLFHGEEAAIDEAVAARRKSAALFETVQAQALGEIDGAAAHYRAAYDALTDAHAVEAVAARSEAATHHRLDMGGADRGEMLTAQLALAVDKRASFDALKVALDALGAMEDGVQRPIWPKSDLADAPLSRMKE